MKSHIYRGRIEIGPFTEGVPTSDPTHDLVGLRQADRKASISAVLCEKTTVDKKADAWKIISVLLVTNRAINNMNGKKQGTHGSTRPRRKHYEFDVPLSPPPPLGLPAAEAEVTKVMNDYAVEHLRINTDSVTMLVTATGVVTGRRGMHIIGDIITAIGGTPGLGTATVRRPKAAFA
jgi:hypothetical protein